MDRMIAVLEVGGTEIQKDSEGKWGHGSQGLHHCSSAPIHSTECPVLTATSFPRIV
jgi:hypothetical protein